ncbi:hypothetical protein ACKVWC_003889 [Pyricularia oryzae]
MDSREPLFLYKETRLNLEPFPCATVHLHLRASHASQRSDTNGRASENDPTYRLKGLASSSAIFYRKHGGFPRAFLWRVLDSGYTLSVQPVDVCRPEQAADAPLTLHIHFPSPLKPNCIALADSKNSDALNVFAIDESNNLYALLLKADVFRKPSAVDAIPAESLEPFLPTAFSFKHVHRMVAVSSGQLLATLHDGGVLVFDRQSHSHGSSPAAWKETFYNSSGWKQGLRNLLPFQGGPTVRYGKVNMDLTAATSVTVTSMNIHGASFVFTVCLDHRMRIWNGDGAILYTGDLLNSDRSPQDVGKWTIDPSQANLVRIMETSESHCLCATYSPIGTGAFKFWKTTASTTDSLLVTDAFPDLQLVPPTPSSSDIWTLADFGLSQNHSTRTLQLWVLWKNNLTYRVQKLDFKPETIGTSWANDWVDAFADHTVPPVHGSTACDATDTTENWLQLIFTPGRFTRTTVETALTMYEGGLGSAKGTSSKGKKNLAESICAVLGSTASLERDSSGAIDYAQFRATSEIHWRRFYRLLLELDKQRGEALSLAIDPNTGLAWVVCADCVSVVRDCSSIERVYHNLLSPEAKFRDISDLLTAGKAFLDGFSDGMLQTSVAALRAELFEDSSRTDFERIQCFSDKSAFWRQVTDEDCIQVVETLGPNFRLVDSGRLYGDLFSLLDETAAARNRANGLPCTDFGKKLLVKGTHESAEVIWRILFSQVILLVHMENETADAEENPLHARFDIGLVFRQLVAALQRLNLVKLLANRDVVEPFQKPDGTKPVSKSGNLSPISTKRGEESYTITCLEATIGHLLGLSVQDDEPLSTILTDVIVNVCALNSNLELPVTTIQCSMLKRDRPDLALELGAFADHSPWSTYIQGRVSLALRDYDAALVYFKKAAIGMSVPMKGEMHSVGLLDHTERKQLNHGMPEYYAHIVSLYERHKAYSYVVDFARLSLQFAKSQDQSDTRLDMLGRLFSASTAISRFDLAHTALLSMTNTALQQSCLKKLVEKMCETQQNAELVNLPFCNLQSSVDRILEQKCQTANVEVQPGRGVPWHQILYAWRVHHNDHKGAAAVLLDRTNKLKKAGEGNKLVGDDVLDTPVTRQYLMLINALSCVEPKQAWIVTEEGSGHTKPSADKTFEDLIDGLGGAANKDSAELKVLGDDGLGAEAVAWKQVRSLVDLRRDYQDELDRIAAIQNNQFDFAVDDDAMEL